jgi:hypothetical protein
MKIAKSKTLTDIKEYNEEMTVVIGMTDETKRPIILAFNEGGCNATAVDLIDVIQWVKANRPELLNK